MRTDLPTKIFLKDYTPPAYLIDTVEMTVRLDPTATLVSTTLAVRPHPYAASKQPLILDGDELELVSVALNDTLLGQAEYTLTETSLTIPDVPSDSFSLTIETQLSPSTNKKLMGLYQSSGTYCTQCEAEGFRRITFFPDRPDVMSIYTVRIEADAETCPVLLSNGNLVETGALPDGNHFATWHDPHPKPSYLFALVGGALGRVADSFTTASGREIELGIYVEPGNEARCAYAMDALKRSMRWDEEAFGREYDLYVFNIVAVSDFNMGAMENKGLNIFNDKYVLADPETATDTDFANIEAIIAHEYFHNWTGNRITCRDWFQLCLKEGLTVFRDQEFSSDMRSRAVKRIEDVKRLRAQQFPEDAGPLAHPVRPSSYVEINNFYTATVYEKGAEICRMIKTIIGADAFQRGMDIYFEKNDNTAATVEDFIASFEEASREDLSQVMLWYEQSGTPTVTVQVEHSSEGLTLSIRQDIAATPGQDQKQPVPIPLRLGLVGADGSEQTLSTDVPLIDGNTFVLRDLEGSLTLANVKDGSVPSVLRGFSAPIRLDIGLTDRDRTHLATYDSDPFNRWEAIQSIASTSIIEAIRGRQTLNEVKVTALGSAFEAVMANDTLDDAFKALAISLPSETDLALQIAKDVDPDAIHATREALKTQLRLMLRDQIVSLLEKLTDDHEYTPDAEGSGKRALKNGMLALITDASAPGDVDRIVETYKSATNMTDRMAALSLATHVLSPDVADPLLADFYDRFEDNHLVIDKWFTVQATNPQPGRFETIKLLTDHEAFSWDTPNRVRSVFGAFAMANPTQFHAPDAAGYAFVADAIIKLDGINPQVAARLTTAFRSWRSLEQNRREKAVTELKRVADTANLSRDVQDLCERSLAG